MNGGKMGQKPGMQAFTEGKRRLTGKVLVLATGNEGKIFELRQVLAGSSWEVAGAAALGVEMPRELTLAEGATFAGNARLKAEAVCAQTGAWSLADDSGLEVDALDGTPGVDTAHYGGFDKLLKALVDVPEMERGARFRCVLALARPGRQTELFEGSCTGRISPMARGTGGFGYDPVFIVENETRTFAEMAPEEKKAYSHRGAALKAFLGWLESQSDA